LLTIKKPKKKKFKKNLKKKPEKKNLKINVEAVLKSEGAQVGEGGTICYVVTPTTLM
jgi:hypothetical protein